MCLLTAVSYGYSLGTNVYYTGYVEDRMVTGRAMIGLDFI
jgi:hypothetical protein